MNDVQRAIEIAKFAMGVGSAIVEAITHAIASGDGSILDKPVREVLGTESAMDVEHRIAEARAEQKFGPRP